jgi:lipopolysaccharide export system protein LptA
MTLGRAEKRASSGHPGWILALLMLLAGQWCLALPDDREQPIHISADEALRDEKQGVTVYSGNVQMNQGSMHIEADRVTIYHVEADADKIVARGRPAKMRQRPDLEKGPVHARALTIEYYQREQKVQLREEARIEQDGAIVTGDSIDYFIAQELVKADSDSAREGNRVQVVIPPSMQQDINLTPPAEPGPATDAGTTTDGAQTALGQRESGETGTVPVDAGGEGGGIPADSQ